MIRRALLMTAGVLSALVVTGCDGSPAPVPTAPWAPAPPSASRHAAATSSDESSPRRGALHLIKECSQYTGLAGSFCTITSSNLKAIKVGTRVVYAKADGATTLDSDITLYPPDEGQGEDLIFGHVVLDNAPYSVGPVTLSGGTGKFAHFHARAVVSQASADGIYWAWDGTYAFDEAEKNNGQNDH